MLALASPDTPLTITVAPPGTSRRFGVDRDEDGIFDRTELEYGYDPLDPASRPDNQSPRFDGLAEPYRFVHPGMTVQVVFSADDPDLPAQSLTFSLETDAPAGASINPTSGLFTWTPTLEQSDVNQEIRVRVTDSGVPPLIDVISLGVIVQTLRVEFQDSNQAGGTKVIVASTIHHRTIPGRRYRLQYKERLESSTWLDGDSVTATGAPMLLLDSTATNTAQRFYRVVLVE